MKKNILYLILFFAGMTFLAACSDDDPNKSNTIFDEVAKQNSFDKWLDKNYVQPYNIRVAYRIEDVQTDFNYNVIPADLKKSKQMAIILKHLWLEAYTEVADDKVHFIREAAPKLLHFIGSAEHDPEQGTIRLGVAEGGHKITITQINELDPKVVVSQYFFNTVHHEFGHILHQTKNFPTEFNEISASDYSPTGWINWTKQQALALGFVTPYAGNLPQEDFVEVLANYVTTTDAEWSALLEAADVLPAKATMTGRAKIERKFQFVKEFLADKWGVDIHELKKVVWRRAGEIQEMDFDNLDF